MKVRKSSQVTDSKMILVIYACRLWNVNYLVFLGFIRLCVCVLFCWWLSHIQWFQGIKKVKAQGIGVHKPEEIEEFGKRDIKVLSDILADKPFFFGDEPTTVGTQIYIIPNGNEFTNRNVSFHSWTSCHLPSFLNGTSFRKMSLYR